MATKSRKTTVAAAGCCVLLAILFAGELLLMAAPASAAAAGDGHERQAVASAPAGLPVDPKLTSACAFCYAYSCPSDCKGWCGC